MKEPKFIDLVQLKEIYKSLPFPSTVDRDIWIVYIEDKINSLDTCVVKENTISLPHLSTSVMELVFEKVKQKEGHIIWSLRLY